MNIFWSAVCLDSWFRSPRWKPLLKRKQHVRANETFPHPREKQKNDLNVFCPIQDKIVLRNWAVYLMLFLQIILFRCTPAQTLLERLDICYLLHIQRKKIKEQNLGDSKYSHIQNLYKIKILVFMLSSPH